MDLIVSEKAIAGENIAQLLADGNVKNKFVSGAKVFEFNWKGKEIMLVPLRGHISDVEYPTKYANWRGVDVRELINPDIIVYSEKEFQIINAIKELAPGAENIIIATDADREGESIGLEAITYAKSTNKDIGVKRAYFSAIAKSDIDKSFNSLEKFDYNFAYSANARRELDLVWGAVLTRFLSIVSGQIGKDFLSVGRVQTPTLALVVDREKERLAFESKKFWEIVAHCEKDLKLFDAMHQEEKFWEKEKALIVFNKQPKKAIVKKVDKKTRVLKKPVPFNTTEFLRAATGIGFAAGRAMDVAEHLYQKGYTSYPRTDNSTYPESLDLKEILNKLVSVKALTSDVLKILALKEIVPSAGKLTKDHPPIYPVTPVQKEMLSLEEWKIYELICRRFLATLAEDAKTENTSALLDAEGEPYIAKGQIILHAGWKEVYPYSELNETILPKLEEGNEVKINKLDLTEKETQPPNRYSQGSLIKLMEDNNLGTKSTRPSIIQKLYFRKYISGNKSIEPSKVAFSVIDSLQKHCETVTKPEMTADLEKQMDEIAAGTKAQRVVVDKSCSDLKQVMDLLFKNKESVALELRMALKHSEIMGKCTCGSNLVVRHGKTGKRFVGCAGYPNCTVTFALPQKGVITPLNEYCPECKAPTIQVKNGRFSYKMCLNMTCVSKKDWVKKEDKKTSSSSVVSTGVKKEPKVKKEAKPKVAKAKVEKQSDTKSIKVNEVK
ncbi:MAG: DNA topoisomerase I [archaeon]|jgi:DNA topoisomerase-1